MDTSKAETPAASIIDMAFTFMGLCMSVEEAKAKGFHGKPVLLVFVLCKMPFSILSTTLEVLT